MISNRLLSSLKRCEELLQARGVKLEDDPATSDTKSSQDILAPASTIDEGQMIDEHGHSRYLEKYAVITLLSRNLCPVADMRSSNLWKGLSDEVIGL